MPSFSQITFISLVLNAPRPFNLLFRVFFDIPNSAARERCVNPAFSTYSANLHLFKPSPPFILLVGRVNNIMPLFESQPYFGKNLRFICKTVARGGIYHYNKGE